MTFVPSFLPSFCRYLALARTSELFLILKNRFLRMGLGGEEGRKLTSAVPAPFVYIISLTPQEELCEAGILISITEKKAKRKKR